jgi:hypothetical protein
VCHRNPAAIFPTLLQSGGNKNAKKRRDNSSIHPKIIEN